MKLRDLVRRGKRPLPGPTDDTSPTVGDGRKDARARGEATGCPTGADAGSTTPQELSGTESGSGDTHTAQESLSWNDLWTEAYGVLKDDPEHTKLLAAFEKYVVDGNDAALDAVNKALPDSGARGFTGGTEKTKQVQELAQRKLDKLPEARLSFSIGDKTIVVRDVVRKTIGYVTTFKDVISAAISAEPGAGLAWAGVMSILTLVENTLQQDEDAASGLNKIVYLLVRYRRLQDEVIAPEFNDSSLSMSARAVFLEIRTKIISIYAQVYVYEIRFVLQYARGRAHRAARNVVSADEWKTMWAGIESTSLMIDQGVREHVSARMLDAVNDIIIRAETIETLQRTTLESVQDGNQTRLLLSLTCATNAIFDSAEVVGTDAPCLEGTRRDILHHIQDWAEDPTGEIIFWLHGMAGTVKTSIALTVANALSARQPFIDGREPPRSTFLGASFFFKQGDATRNSTKTFFPTLAQCLAQGIPDLRIQIADAIANNLQISTKAPQQQFDGLVIKPLLVLNEEMLMSVRLVVVVDALDECISQKEVRDLIGMLEALEVLHQVQLRLLITSRRDDHILKAFTKLPVTMYRPSLLDKVQASAENDNDVDDITKYLTHTLARIADDYNVEPGWIDRDDIVKLGKKADGLFIYAATICRFLDSEDFEDEVSRQERLDRIFDGGRETDAPQNKVDEIYLNVLSFPHLAKSTQVTKTRFYKTAERILGSISVFFKPVSASSLSVLLSLGRDELDKTLRRLHAILDVPQDLDAPVGLVHLSFRDFLLDEERSRELPFRVEEMTMHREVFERCLDLMRKGLHEDMCKLVAPGHLASKVSRSKVDVSVPPYLQYACRYWVDHLAKLGDNQRRAVGLEDDGHVHVFLREKLLFWLEVMRLIGETSAAVLTLDRLSRIVGSAEHPLLSGLLYDARRFVLGNRWVIEQAPLQLYSSALIFSPTNSKVRSQFKHLIPSWITRLPEVDEDWPSELSVLEGDPAPVCSVSFSPVDDLLVSGSKKGTTIVWDYVTGTELYKFEDSDPITCVKFSPDGGTVASAFCDGKIKVREFAKGRLVDLIGHTNSITAVAFSSKSSGTLVSISDDYTIRTWNIGERRAVHVWSVPAKHRPEAVFSPGADLVVCRTYTPDGGDVELWEVGKGEPRVTFKGHVNYDANYNIDAFAISPDGKIVASALSKRDPISSQCSSSSSDATTDVVVEGEEPDWVKVWDVATGQTLHESRYEDIVEALAFSPQKEGLMAIATRSGAVEIRRANTWDRVQSFNTDVYFKNLTFSRDGKFLATGWLGGDVRLYDAEIDLVRPGRDVSRGGHTVSLLLGEDHLVLSTREEMTRIFDAEAKLVESIPGRVRCWRVSPDGRLVGLLMEGYIVQLWTTCMTRKPITYEGVQDIAFSPDSSRIVLVLKDGARIIESTNFEETATYEGARDILFSPDSRRIAVLLDDETRLIDSASLEETATFARPSRETFAFWPDSRLVSWEDLSEGTHVLDLSVSEERVIADTIDPFFSLAFSQNGKLIALTEEDNEDHPHTWLSRTRKKKIFFTKGYTRCDILIEFPPSASVVATGAIGATEFSVWDTTLGGKVHTLKVAGEKPVIYDPTFSSAGDLMAAAIVDIAVPGFLRTTAIMLWDLMTGMEIGRLYVDAEIPYPSFSCDSRHLESRNGRIPLPSHNTNRGAVLSDTLSGGAHTCLYVTRQWVVQGFDNLLWIPPVYRAPQPAVKDETVMFGLGWGGVGLLRLDLAATPRSNQGNERAWVINQSQDTGPAVGNHGDADLGA